MSDVSDDGSRKGNGGRPHKPRRLGDKDKAPKGSVGLTLKAPGFGTAREINLVFVPDDEFLDNNADLEPTKEEQRAEYLNNLPEGTEFTDLTGDEEVDQKSFEDGTVPVTPEELKALRAAQSESEQKLEGPQISRSDYAEAFQRATERSLERQQSRDQDMD